MERIITAIETIEANTARMFGLEDEKTRAVFVLTESLRILFENEEAAADSSTMEREVVCFNDLLEMDEEEAMKVIADLPEKETEAFLREGMCRLIDKMFG